MTLNEIVQVFVSGEKAEVKRLLSNRVLMTESKLRMVGELLSDYPEVEIAFNPMSEANEYIVRRDGNYMGSQFYWKNGYYDARGIHSLYDEYGREWA